MTNFEDLQKLAKDNFDKQVASLTLLQKGAQEAVNEIADYSKKALEANSAVFSKLAGVKTLDKAVEIQSEFAKASYEGFVQHFTKLSTIAADAAKNAYKPIETALTRGQ